MPNREIHCRFGLIGNNFDLKENISLEINKDGKIVKIRYDDLKKNIELTTKTQNFLLIPGLINSHIHIGDNFAKELGFNKNLIEIVTPPHGLKHQLLSSTSNEIKFNGIKNAIIEMLSNGITCFMDFRERSIEGINFLKEGLKNTLINYLIFGRFEKTNEIESIFKLADGIGLASYRKLTKDNKERVKFYKNKYKKPIACHDAELKRDNDLLEAIINDDLTDIIIHGTHYTMVDLKLIKKNNLSLVMCPRSNGYFGVGFPPIINALKLKIPISLGTDNLMANNPDLFEELRYLYRISRVLGKEEKNFQLSAKELLKMITINAAKNFNLHKDFGSIIEGKYANFCMIDLAHPNFFSYRMDSNTIFPLIVQRTKSENIKKTYIKGVLAFERK